jgi:hypothetical protein
MRYLLDANVFMEGRKRHYGFDFCPAFWDWIDRENAAERVFSIEKVRTEINAGDDDLIEWAAARESTLFIAPDQGMLDSLPRIRAWVTGRDYTEGAINTFLDDADHYLVSQALSRGDVVVTHESSAPLRKGVVKIPDVCIGFGITCMTPFEMLRRERARFVLGPQP